VTRSTWSVQAAPLYATRAARILHIAAAVFALGVIGSLYVRGLAFEYRATWESTFLDAATVRSLLAVAYAPGALLSGIAVPDAAHIAAIRGQPAKRGLWLHLMAATLVVVAIVPRVVLALGTGWSSAIAQHVLATASTTRISRLLRGFRKGRSPCG
jgi:hypothetical protein